MSQGFDIPSHICTPHLTRSLGGFRIVPHDKTRLRLSDGQQISR